MMCVDIIETKYNASIEEGFRDLPILCGVCCHARKSHFWLVWNLDFPLSSTLVQSAPT